MYPSPVDQIEALRRQVTESISSSGLGAAALDDWDQTIAEHGRASRYRNPGTLLGDLVGDFADLSGHLQRRHCSSTLRRLTRVTAQMAGLIFLTLIKLDEQEAARSWARTARIAAQEAGDPTVQSWVRAQEAYVLYYSGRYAEAIAVARDALDIAGRGPCVGAVLAAALAARAWGRLGHAHDARAAIDVADRSLSRLDGDSHTASAFGYNEAQLRFHEGNALTHLHETRHAWDAQQRALDLYPDNDHLDRTLVRLDQACCLAYDGELPGALTCATDALMSLPDEERQGLLIRRGREVFQALPTSAQSAPAAREFRSLLMTAATPDGADR